MQVVYHDPSYATSWINENWSRRIAEYLSDKGFEEKDAEELKVWMKDRVRRGDVHKSVAVFSQDMIPETILDSLSSPNSLVRRYLDAGGRIVWIGDIPFWSKAKPKNTKPDREEIWQHGAHYGMLGVQPLIAESSSECEGIGKWNGKMKSRWYSQRPVNVEAESKCIETLGLKVDVLAHAEVTLLPCSFNALVIARWKKTGKKIGSFGLSILGTGGNVTLTEEFPEELSLKPLKLACAWHVIFNKEYPNQGFYRFWDTGSCDDEPPESLLEDIYTLSTL